MLATVLSTGVNYFTYIASKPYDICAVIPLMLPVRISELPMRIFELGEVK